MGTRISNSGFRLLSLGSLGSLTDIAAIAGPHMRRSLTPSWEQHVLSDRNGLSSGNPSLFYQLNPTNDNRGFSIYVCPYHY